MALIMGQASVAMGITSGQGSANKNFSNKVLKIEFSGPKREHFSILDLPGIFSARTSKGISKEDMEGVTRLVSSYMDQRENIIM